MKSRFSIGGHPIHPMLVTVPIGLFVWAFVADLIYVASGREQVWYDIAFWTGIAAVVTALAAAVPGMGDYLTMAIYSSARAHATAHLLLNGLVIALFFAAILLMLDNGATDGTALATVVVIHGLGVGLVTLSGVLGGEMVYRHHLGVIPENAEIAREEVSRHARERGKLEARQ